MKRKSIKNPFKNIMLNIPKKEIINNMINNIVVKPPKVQSTINNTTQKPIKKISKKPEIKITRSTPKRTNTQKTKPQATHKTKQQTTHKTKPETTQKIKQKKIMFEKTPKNLDVNYKNIKLPTSIYMTKNEDEVISLNQGKYLVMNDMCFIYQKSSKQYYNHKMKLIISSKDNTFKYYVRDLNSNYIEITYKKYIPNIYQMFQILSFYPFLNHPITLTFEIKPSVTFYILCHVIDNNFILDLSNNDKSYFNDDIHLKLSKYLDNDKLCLPFNKKILKMVEWKIDIYTNLINMSFNKNNEVILKGDIFKEHFESIKGTCDFCIRGDVL